MTGDNGGGGVAVCAGSSKLDAALGGQRSPCFLSLREHCRDIDGFTVGAMPLCSCEGEESVDDPREPGAFLERGVAGERYGGWVVAGRGSRAADAVR